MVETYSFAADEGYVAFIEMLETLALIVYYWYENLVFACRTKMVGFTEKDVDSWGNMSWFLEDFFCLLSSIVRTTLNLRKLRDKQNSLEALTASDDEAAPKSGDTSVYSMHRRVKNDLQRELFLLKRQFWDSVISLIISVLEVGASAEAIDLFRIVFGTAIGDAGMGLFGVCSSSVILVNFVRLAVRKETEQQQTPLVTSG